MELSEEQHLAFEKYKQKKNVFITGPGGSGKSALIKCIFKDAQNMEKKIQVCALTGCAALLLGCKAKTVHSWSGIGLGNMAVEHLIARVKSNKYSKSSWKKTNILVIDEVSMLSLKLFNALNKIGQSVRENNRPFGGIQVIFSGDFYQLPPVGKNPGEPDEARFCFESDDWNRVFEKDCQIQLITIFRQSGDPVYSKILNEIRVGKMKRKSVDILEAQVKRKIEEKLVAEPTKLFPTKNKVEYINSIKMSELETEERIYEIKNEIGELENNEIAELSSITKEMIKTELTYLSSNVMCEKQLKLKIGAQVMCIVNIQDEKCCHILVCNGSQGIITGFCPITDNPRVKYNNGLEMVMERHVWPSEKIPVIGLSQIPLILAWALTIHKSQGATMDTAEIDVGSNIFECGQTYVALSRVKSLEGLYLTGFDVNKIKVSKKVQEFYRGLNETLDKSGTIDKKMEAEKRCENNVVENKDNLFSKFAYSQGIGNG